MTAKRKPAAKQPAKRPRGRPRFVLDYALIERMAAIQCTDYEIAMLVEMTREGFSKRKRDDPELLHAIEKGYENGKRSLRHAQFKAALNGNPTMMIWLGKQYLGQRDSVERHEHSGPGGKPIELADVPALTDDELEAIIREGG